MRTLEVGDVLFIPAGVIHSATDTGAGNGAELATYNVEKGRPLVTVSNDEVVPRSEETLTGFWAREPTDRVDVRQWRLAD